MKTVEIHDLHKFIDISVAVPTNVELSASFELFTSFLCFPSLFVADNLISKVSLKSKQWSLFSMKREYSEKKIGPTSKDH